MCTGARISTPTSHECRINLSIRRNRIECNVVQGTHTSTKFVIEECCTWCYSLMSLPVLLLLLILLSFDAIALQLDIELLLSLVYAYMAISLGLPLLLILVRVSGWVCVCVYLIRPPCLHALLRISIPDVRVANNFSQQFVPVFCIIIIIIFISCTMIFYLNKRFPHDLLCALLPGIFGKMKSNKNYTYTEQWAGGEKNCVGWCPIRPCSVDSVAEFVCALRFCLFFFFFNFILFHCSSSSFFLSFFLSSALRCCSCVDRQFRLLRSGSRTQQIRRHSYVESLFIAIWPGRAKVSSFMRASFGYRRVTPPLRSMAVHFGVKFIRICNVIVCIIALALSKHAGRPTICSSETFRSCSVELLTHTHIFELALSCREPLHSTQRNIWLYGERER